MATYYNLTNVTDANNTLQQVAALNQLAGGWLGIMMLLMMYVLLFVLIKSKYGIKQTLVGSSTMTSIVAMLLLATGLIRPYHALVVATLTFASFFFAYVSQDD